MAGLYLLLGADFLAATQLLIYVGGILVLLLFGVMLTHKIYDLDLKSGTQPVRAGPDRGGRPVRDPRRRRRCARSGPRSRRRPRRRRAEIGELFMGQYLLPFEAASVLLLVALVGAAMIVRRRRDA